MKQVGRRSLVACICLMAVTVAGCGDSEDSESASQPSGATSTATEQSGTDYAAVVKEFLVPKPATWEGPTEAPAPPAGKTIAIVSAAEVLEGAHRQVVGAQAAAKAIGWDSYVCDGKGDPAQQNRCTQEAIRKGVDGIFWPGVDPNVVRQGADAAEKAKIPIVTGYNYGQASSKPPEDISKGVIADVSSDQCEAGKALAAYMFANTEGGKPKVAMVTDPGFPIVVLRYECTKAALEEGGAEILSSQNIRGADVATKGPGVGSALLQKNPEGSIDWIYAPYDAAALFIGQGITSSGRDDVKMVSFDANPPNLEMIKKGGPQVADITSPLEWMGWAAVDSINRHIAGETVEQEYGLPVQLLTKENVEAPEEGADYETEFKKIWGK
jgi:ribose transport system substrate-binding protein